ncbi:MAG: hypothetical protein LBU12_00750 [Deltaproteobacteria bacterium]|nr:hypothetical protein [Deltaproteobacteria bacterium]
MTGVAGAQNGSGDDLGGRSGDAFRERLKEEPDSSSALAAAEERLARLLPGAVDFFRRRGATTLGQTARLLNAPHGRPSATLLRAAARLASEGRQPRTAQAAVDALAQGRPVLAAGHHGLETHPELAQGGLLFGLPAILDREPRPTVALASSAVPLNNPTAPGGLLLGRRRADGRRLQLRLFPRSQDQIMVSRAPALTRQAVTACLTRLPREDGWSPPERRAAAAFLERFLLAPAFLAWPSFAAQAAWLASEVWAARFRPAAAAPPPPLVQLELEALAADCLVVDLARPDSPAARTLFEPRVREALTADLAGRRGAWSASLLALDASDRRVDGAPALGTLFFWGVDPKGRRLSLALGRRGRQASLVGPGLEVPLTPGGVAEALADRRIVPGLFLDYLVLAAHGLRAHGGVYMLDYLPRLLAPAARRLEVPLGWTPLLAAGPLPLGLQGPEGFAGLGGFTAAGGLELAGPWPSGLFEALDALPLAAVWPFTAGEWLAEETPPAERGTGGRSPGPPALRLEDFGGGWRSA